MKTTYIAALYFILIQVTGLHAQESVNSAGGNTVGSGGSVSYSVGQVIYQTHTGISCSAAEGVQHPYEILVVTGIEEPKGINLTVTSYPKNSCCRQPKGL